MPSPYGHALAGISAAWAIDLLPRARQRAVAASASVPNRSTLLALTCAGLAAIPDADLLFGVHRTFTHSITAALLVTIVAAAVTGWVTTGDRPAWRVGLTCGAAYATHLLLDWLAIDRFPPSGIQLLWPWSREWFISGLDLFPQTQRSPVFAAGAFKVNLYAATWESILLLPIVALLWAARHRFMPRSATASVNATSPPGRR